MKEFCAGMPRKWAVVGDGDDSASASEDWDIDRHLASAMNKVLVSWRSQISEVSVPYDGDDTLVLRACFCRSS